MTRRPRPTRIRRAFTLIETIGTIAVLGALGSGASFILLNAVDGFSSGATEAQLHAEASIALDRMVREMRGIGLDADAATVAPDIDDVSPNTIIWRDAEDDLYRLGITGTTLELAVDGEPDRTLLEDVSAFVVQTYDEDDTALAGTLTGVQCDAIRRVRLTVTLQRDGVTETLRSKVFLRSVMVGAGS